MWMLSKIFQVSTHPTLEPGCMLGHHLSMRTKPILNLQTHKHSKRRRLLKKHLCKESHRGGCRTAQKRANVSAEAAPGKLRSGTGTGNTPTSEGSEISLSFSRPS